MQAEFLEASLAEACSWKMVVLIPKRVGKYFQGIRLVGYLWKFTTGIINQWLTSEITYHHNLHGFRMGHGTGNAILEANFIHHLSAMK